ncbi:MAG: vWA domain-containing protein [Enhygromyxa sp.]
MRRTTLASALALAAACGLGACGGDDSKDSSFGSLGDSETTGDGDGDQEGDGDGDQTGDGDGDTGDGDGDTGDGDGDTGDGDGDTGDGDGDTGDGDGDTGDGDGDGDTGDGDGDTGDGDGDTGDGDGDTGDGDGDTGGQEIIPCQVPEVALATVVPHVVLVLDKSGSMIQNTWDHDADPMTPEVTRWKSLHSVVSLVVNNFDDQFEFGAQLYPSTDATNEYNDNACLVNSPLEVAVAPDNAAGVLLGIPIGTSQNIRGGTPAAAGMSSAIDHLLDIDDGDPAAIILVTDGAANCRTDAVDEFDLFETYDPNLLPIVADAYNDLQIPTYVVGIDISDQVTLVTGVNEHPPDGEPDGISPFAQLNELAMAGGKPLGGLAEFYQTENEIELQAAIQAIVDDAASCTIYLDPVPPFPNLVEVVMDDQNLPQVDDCESEDGWAFTNPDGPYDSLELCGSWCDQVPQAETLKAEYYCNPG